MFKLPFLPFPLVTLWRLTLICLASTLGPGLIPSIAQANKFSDEVEITKWVSEAEKLVYSYDIPDYLQRVSSLLDKIEEIQPTLPYIYWARARVAFFAREEYHAMDLPPGKKNFDEEKLALAKECHGHTNQCILVAPKNAECHLMKGACYSMQASTWGNRLQTLRILKPMDKEFKLAMNLPTDFQHKNGEITTRQLAQILRGILYRLMPDSWWLQFLARIRGDKQKAYDWLKEGVVGPFAKEPTMILELGVAAICLGREKDQLEKINEGFSTLRDGLKLPIRNRLDAFDQQNMRHILDNPKEACKYRRERFEDISQAPKQD